MRLVKKAGIKVEAKWVKGHGKDPLNKRVDRLAKQSAKTATTRRLGHQRVRRKKSPLQTELGSVRMEGQTTTIRIITDKWLPSPHQGGSHPVPGHESVISTPPLRRSFRCDRPLTGRAIRRSREPRRLPSRRREARIR
jgi:hypothetical protein